MLDRLDDIQHSETAQKDKIRLVATTSQKSVWHRTTLRARTDSYTDVLVIDRQIASISTINIATKAR